MKRLSGPWRLLAVLLLAALTAGCSSSPPKPDTSAADAVTASFNAYAAAVNAKDGVKSADLMSASSRAYYDNLRNLALDADQKTLNQQKLLDQITVLSMRANLTPAVLRDADPKQLVSVMVEKDVISQNSDAAQKLTRIQVSGDKATADLVLPADSGQTTYPVNFEREDGAWHYDITSLVGAAEAAIQKAATVQKMSGPKLVSTVMETRVGKAKAKTLWTPIGRA